MTKICNTYDVNDFSFSVLNNEAVKIIRHYSNCINLWAMKFCGYTYLLAKQVKHL